MMSFFRFIYVACRLPGPSERLLRDAYQCGRGWVGVAWGNGGIPGPESGEWVADSGNGIGELVARESGCGKREFGIRRNPEFAEFGNRNGFGIDGCAHLCTESGNSAEFTPGNPPETAPETPRKPPN